MAAPTRQAMRLLSPRLQCLHSPPTPTLRQLRHASRYSNPSQRGVASSPAQQSSFLGNASAGGQGQIPVLPIDGRVDDKAREEKRQYHLQRMRFAGMGLMLSFGAMILIIFNLDLDGMEQPQKNKKQGLQMDASGGANADFQGKEIHIIGAGEGKRIVASGDGEEVELVETGTSNVPHFPRTIHLPASSESAASGPDAVLSAQPNTALNPGNMTNQEEYTLVGLGIRTVMWIEVYVVGMYIRTKDISALQEKLIHSVNSTASTLIPSEKEGLKSRLMDPEQSRKIWSAVLQVPGIKSAWRIAPTRNTDFGHLRDGFVNGINARKAEARKVVAGGETEYDSETFGAAVQDLKSIFAGGKAPKGSILILKRDTSGALDVLYQAKPEGKRKEMEVLGTVQDERISKLMWLGYLAGDKVSSKSARDGVVDGCVSFASRPVGSVETMVV